MTANCLLEMFPGELTATLQTGQDIALLPIGSIEQHGPHLLLGTDGFWAEALVQEIGRLSGGAVLPPVPFSWVGCTNVFAGGVGVREAEFIAYLRAAVVGLWQAGFRRLVIVNGHGGNFYALRAFPHEVWQEHRIPVLCLYGSAGCREAEELVARVGGGEGTWLAGALRLLGREDLITVLRETTRQAVAEFGDRPEGELEPPSARAARQLGVVGHDYSHECLHVAPDARLDPDTGARAITMVAQRVAAVLDDLGAYVRSLPDKP